MKTALIIIVGLAAVIGGALLFGATPTQAGQAGGLYLVAWINWAWWTRTKKTPR